MRKFIEYARRRKQGFGPATALGMAESRRGVNTVIGFLSTIAMLLCALYLLAGALAAIGGL